MKNVFKLSLAFSFHLVIMIGSFLLFWCTKKSPLLASFGFESANLFVVVMGPLFLCAASCNSKLKNSFTHILVKELLWLLIHVLFYSSLLFINGLHILSCSEGSGYLAFFVVLIPPLLLNMSLGALIAALFARSSIKALVVIMGYSAYAGWLFWSWWSEPTFRLLSHLSVIITSDLLAGDTLSPAVVGFRQATLLLALAVITVGGLLSERSPRLYYKTKKRTFISIVSAGLLLVAAYSLQTTSLMSLGKNRFALEHDYQLMAENSGIKIFADNNKVSPKKAQEILDEALLYRQRIGKQLGHITNAPITIWLHAKNEDKYLYTGANNVHFALPKHREIHIYGTTIPHPVLGHELAHIYIGEYSNNWLGIPADNFFVGNFALSEGLAMYLTKELNLTHDMTMLEQARALYHANIRINIKDLFHNNLNFALLNNRAAYIYAGAFLEFLLDDVSMKKNLTKELQELIRLGSLDKFLPNNPSPYFEHFDKYLSQAIPTYQTLWAKNFFQAKSILLMDCHADLSTETKEVLLILNDRDVKKLTAEKFKLVAKHSSLFFKTIDTMMAEGHFEEADALMTLGDLYAPDLGFNKNPDLAMDKLKCLINLMKYDQALAFSKTLNMSAYDIAKERFIIVSKVFLQAIVSHHQSALSKAALAFLVSPAEKLTLNQVEFAFAVGQNSHENIVFGLQKSLADYLYARLLMQQENYRDALTIIKTLHNNADLPPLIKREVLFMRARAEVSLKYFDEAITSFTDILRSNPSPYEELFIKDKLDRIRFQLRR